MKHIILILFGLFFYSQANASTTLLPNGEQCFATANGPIVSGSVNMFYPSTTTPKPTWQDANQVTLNTQPIQLDSNGCAIIYGVGTYRQQVYSGPVVGGVTTGSLVFDLPTTDTSAYNSTFWAALAGGTPNVITIVDTGFNATDGSVINFTALSTNTASTTINPSGYGAIPVEKDTTAGPVSLVGGEIIQNNVISVVYRSSDNAFHLLNPPIQSISGTTAPRCGLTGLKMVNDSSTPSSIMDLTATTVVLSSASGLTINRANVSTSVNISLGGSTSTAGGMDGEIPGTSAWIDFFLIDNGAATSAVASLAAGNGLSPNLPSGYTYKCYAGAAYVDGSGNLLRILQYGNKSQYTLVSPSNTQTYPAVGTTTSATMAALSVTSVVPPTAISINTIGYVPSGANAQITIGPNNVGAAVSSVTNPSICAGIETSSSLGQMNCSFILEGTSVYAATNAGTLHVFSYGWIDGTVNAP